MAKFEAKIHWLDECESHNYPAALSYLTLLYPPQKAKEIVTTLEAARLSEFKAKDIFRASSLSLMGVSNLHVERDKKKIKKGAGLSPILLVRDTLHGKVIIADGYHRLCAVYSFDEDAVVRCKISDC
jgi:hypothetical protein